ncbi:26968_t:CDS:2 [Dentiscutata erythropus]|uniref:26968_t:CDS:1 n=1 Tax=Dentiscutata erythropus TaxID=1348616 RepID=A0A9N9NJ10_9GLOM|nr:26968_t:CDS:2 [Dentiscutata erythropus]
MQIAVDGIWNTVKYKEGFIAYSDSDTITCTDIVPYDNIDDIRVVPSPYQCWSSKNLYFYLIADYMLCAIFAFQAGVLFLMQSFWSYMASQLSGKPFMDSWEFRAYNVWGLISFIIFPFTKWLTGRLLNINYVGYIPQILFAMVLVFIVIIGIRNQRKLCFLVRSLQNQKSSQEAILRIRYFIEMNRLLILGVGLVSACMFIIDIDAMTFAYISNYRILMDLIMLHMNLGTAIIWITIILIVYPRYYMTGIHGSKALSKKSLRSLSIAVDKTGITIRRPSSTHETTAHLNPSSPINLFYRYLSNPASQSTPSFSDNKTDNNLLNRQQRVHFE